MEHPTTLVEFMEAFPGVEECRRAIFEHRWPDGRHEVLYG